MRRPRQPKKPRLRPWRGPLALTPVEVDRQAVDELELRRNARELERGLEHVSPIVPVWP